MRFGSTCHTHDHSTLMMTCLPFLQWLKKELAEANQQVVAKILENQVIDCQKNKLVYSLSLELTLVPIPRSVSKKNTKVS